MSCNCIKLECNISQGTSDICTRCDSEGFYCGTHGNKINKHSNCCYHEECEEEPLTAGAILASQFKGEGIYSDKDLINQAKKQLPSNVEVKVS